MKDQYRTKKQLIKELEILREQVTKLKRAETKRKRAEKALKESEARFRLLYENAPLGYQSLDENGHFLEVNKAWLDLFGYSRKEVIGRWFGDFLSPQSINRHRENFSRFKSIGEIHGVELEMIQKDGSHIAVSFEGKIGYDEKGNFKQTHCILNNITERKRTEEELTRLSIAMRMSRDSIVLSDLEGKITDVNKASLEMYGTDQQVDLIGKNYIDLIAPEEKEKAIEGLGRVLKEGYSLNKEYHILNKSGGKISAEISASVMKDIHGKPIGLVGVIRDITERKLAEEALQESEAQYRRLVETLPEVIYSLSAGDGTITSLNPAFERITGWSQTEWLGKPFMPLVHPDDLSLAAETFQQVLRGKAAPPYELRILSKSGEYLVGEFKSVPNIKKGKVVGEFGIARDITERKKVEEALKKKSEEQALLLDNIQTRIWYLTDPETYRAVNKAHAEFFEKKKEELENKKLYDIYRKEEAEVCIAGNKQVFEKKIQLHNEEWLTNAKDEKRLFDVTKSPKLDGNGNVEYVVCSAEDITERKEMEKALRESEERYHSFFDNSIDAVLLTAPDGSIFTANPEACRIFGYTEEELCQSGRIGVVDTLDPRLSIALEERNRTGSFKGELNLIRKDGTKFPAEISSAIFKDKNGNFKTSMTIRDITERKRAEEKLKISESLLKEAQHVASIGHWELDPGVGIPTWSEEIFHIFGLDPAQGEPSFKDHQKIIHPDDWNILNKAVTTASTEGVPFDIEFRLLHLDRNIRWMNAKGYAIRDSEGHIVRIFGTAQDISERKHAEEERERLFQQVRIGRERMRTLSHRLVQSQEVYRHDLARELHDRVGQNLTALSLNLNIIQNQLSPESITKIGSRIEDSQKLLEETVERIRDVMAELRPSILDDYGLMATLRWYGDRFSKQTDVTTVIQGEEWTPRLPVPVELVLFRITQEALNNVVKHAQAKQVTITLKKVDEKVYLTIVDDGVGFDPTAHHQPGARPEWGVISMRERAEGVGGQFHIQTAPGKGTKIIVEVPRQN